REAAARPAEGGPDDRLAALWAELQALARDRQLDPEALVAEARQSMEARLGEEIDALFGTIIAQAEEQRLDELFASFVHLRELLARAEALPLLRPRVDRWRARLADLGELSFAIQLQVAIGEANAALQAMAGAVEREDWDTVRRARERLDGLVAELAAGDHPGMRADAAAIAERVRALADRARALQRVTEAGLVIDRILLEGREGPQVVVDGRAYAEGDVLSGVEPPIRVVKIEADRLRLEVDGVEVDWRPR
ncbi:MAG: hypothetical protein KF878_29690, partial [Planctomycetes bacterium]|nr:hypothetical protein [Planctomycetota bacterium]